MNTLLYLRCPRSERAATETVLRAAGLSVMWADNVAHAIEALQRFEMPVLLDLSADAPALQAAARGGRWNLVSAQLCTTNLYSKDAGLAAIGVSDRQERPIRGSAIEGLNLGSKSSQVGI